MILEEYSNSNFVNNIKSFFASFSLHIIVLTLLVVGKFSSKAPPSLPVKKIDLKKMSMRVDIVSMPVKTLQELSKADFSQINETDEGKNNKVVLKNENQESEIIEENSKEKLSSMLKMWDKNLPSEHEVHIQEKMSKSSKKYKKRVQEKTEIKKLIMRGNKLNKGVVNSFESQNIKVSELELYSAIVVEKIRTFWKVPRKYIDKNFSCRIKVYISEKGKLLKYEIIESSGEQLYDNKALNSIKMASPFPNVPQKIHHIVKDGHIILGFPL